METATTTKRFLHAKYWHYDGNYEAGHNSERYDPHGFGLPLISFAAYAIQNQHLITGVSLQGAKVTHSKGDNFGHEVSIAATDGQWQAIKKAWLTGLAERRVRVPVEAVKTEEDAEWVVANASVPVHFCESVTRDKDRRIWALDFDEDVINELFLQAEGETVLEMFENGYYPTLQTLDGQTLWLKF